MAKKIEWSETAIKDRFNIYVFWEEKNKSSEYSEKLEKLFNEAARLISEFPELGTATDIVGLRVKVVKGFKLFYHNSPDSIQIIRIWDSRRDPRSFRLK